MFYKQGRCIMTWCGVVHHTWMQPTGGLIQGCPLSPVALTAIMSRWAVSVEKVATANVYADDRAAWCVSHSPEEAAQSVAVVLRVSRGFDTKHGFTNNMGKAQVFASTAEGKEAAGRMSPSCPPATSRFKLLGIRYEQEGGEVRASIAPDTLRRAQRRLRRLGATCRAMVHRQLHLRSLVLPMLSWAGALVRHDEEHLKALRRDTLVHVVGNLGKSQSNMLLWLALLDEEDDISFVLDMATLRHLRRRAKEAL